MFFKLNYCIMKGIFMKMFLLVLFPLSLFAQGKIVGTITNKGGEPLPGANVFLLNTSLGAATDNDGQYIITQVPVGDYTLVTSILGYKEQNLQYR